MNNLKSVNKLINKNSIFKIKKVLNNKYNLITLKIML